MWTRFSSRACRARKPVGVCREEKGSMSTCSLFAGSNFLVGPRLTPDGDRPRGATDDGTSSVAVVGKRAARGCDRRTGCRCCCCCFDVECTSFVALEAVDFDCVFIDGKVLFIDTTAGESLLEAGLTRVRSRHLVTATYSMARFSSGIAELLNQ